ncbi:MAG: DUF3987 domain-containing protein [Xanthomonadales bacterium]|nr:DUF3987 domain-containing protein [Xanthomonadales bacterium]
MNIPAPYFFRSGNEAQLDMLPSIAKDAAKAYCAKTNSADPIMVRTYLLSVMSSAAGPFYFIKPPGWNPHPINANTLCIVGTGNSKSPVHDRVIQPLMCHANESIVRFIQMEAKFRAQLDQRKLQVEVLRAEVRRRKRKNEACGEVEAELAALNHNTPKPPKLRPRRAGNIDLEGMVRQLDGNNEAIDFLTDEGERFFSNPLMRHPAELIDLIDGKPLDFIREKKKPLFAINPSGTLGILLQRAVLNPYIPRFKGGEIIKHKTVELGLFARFLIYVAAPMPFGNGYLESDDDDENIAKFHKRLRAMYDKHRENLESGITERIELSFAPDAVGYWSELDRVVHDLKFGQFSHIEDFVSKMLNLTARVASLLHVFESDTHYVSLSALQRAWEIVGFHAGQYEQLFAPPPPMPVQEADVAAVANYLGNLSWPVNLREVPVEPIGLWLNISDRRVRAALLRLENRGMIEFCKEKRGYINCHNPFVHTRNITWR